MALITCDECGGKVSDRASQCPKCGCPVVLSSFEQPAPAAKSKSWILWMVLAPILLGLVVVIGSSFGPQRRPEPGYDDREVAAQKRECAKAMVSSIGHSTVGYADKLAYDAKVREACDGLTMDGKPIGDSQ